MLLRREFLGASNGRAAMDSCPTISRESCSSWYSKISMHHDYTVVDNPQQAHWFLGAKVCMLDDFKPISTLDLSSAMK